MTTTAPVSEAIQKVREGRAPVRTAEKAALGGAVAADAVPVPSSAASTAIRSVAIALSLCLMHERSSVADLAASLRDELNRYSPGEKLPSSRTLIERHRVSPVTVSRALA